MSLLTVLQRLSLHRNAFVKSTDQRCFGTMLILCALAQSTQSMMCNLVINAAAKQQDHLELALVGVGRGGVHASPSSCHVVFFLIKHMGRGVCLSFLTHVLLMLF